MLKAMLKKRKIKFPKAKINEYRDVFNILDINKKGLISVNDFLKIKSIFSYPIGFEEIEEMIKEINKKAERLDGDLDFKAFIELMKKQIQYIDENDEDLIFKSFKEQFKNELLGRKRKREIIYSYENSKIENESEISNYDLISKNSIDIEKSKLNFNLIENKNKKQRSKDFNTQINIFSKLKNINIMIPRQINENEKNDLGNKNYILNNKTRKKECENKLKENSKQNINLKKIENESKNTLEIYKRSLSKELVSQIESKDKNNNPKNKRLNSRKNNSSSFQNKKTKSSSRNNSKYYFRKSNRNNSKNKLNISFPKKSPYSGYSINSRLDRTPLINVQKKKKKLINNCSDNILSEIKEKLINKGIKTKRSKRKNSKVKNAQAAKLRKIVNKNFYGPNSNYKDLISSICSSDNITTENKSLVLNEIEIKKEKSLNISKDKILNKVPEKIINNKITLLYNFEIEYTANKKKEKIIKKVSEIPYSIIIQKIALNLEIQKFFEIKKNLLKSPDLDSHKNTTEVNSSEFNNSSKCNSNNSNEDKNKINNNLIKEKLPEKEINHKKGKKIKQKKIKNKSKNKKKIKQKTGKEIQKPIQEAKSNTNTPLELSIENKQMNKNKSITTNKDKNNSKEMKNSSKNKKDNKKTNKNKNANSKANISCNKNSNNNTNKNTSTNKSKNTNTNNNTKNNANNNNTNNNKNKIDNISINKNKNSDAINNNINKNTNTSTYSSTNNDIINKKGLKIRIKWI